MACMFSFVGEILNVIGKSQSKAYIWAFWCMVRTQDFVGTGEWGLGLDKLFYFDMLSETIAADRVSI